MVFKVKINPVDLSFNWQTGTDYTITLNQGFVREVDGNKTYNSPQTINNAVTTFSSVPIPELDIPVYQSTTRYPLVILNYDRPLLYNSTNTTNYYLYSENTLTQTIASTSTRVSKTTGTVKINLFGLLNTSTSYNIRADQGVFRDIFSLKSNAISDDSFIKFSMSSTYISLAPFKDIETVFAASEYRGGMSTAIGTNLIAVSTVAYPWTDTSDIKSNVRIFNTSGNFLYEIQNPLSHDFRFGISLAMTDSKLIVGATHTSGSNTNGKIVIYNINTSSFTTATTITGPLGSDISLRYFGGKIAYNGSKFITLANERYHLYSDAGTLLRTHNSPEATGSQVGTSAFRSPNITPVAINSTLYAYHAVDTDGFKVYIKNIESGSDVYTLDVILDFNINEPGRFSLEMDETYIMVGDYVSKNCKIYSLATGSLVYTINSPETSPGSFGLYVKMTNDYFMIGDPSYSEVTGYPKGKIYLFGKNDGLLKKIIDNPYFWQPEFNGANFDLEFGINPSIKNNLLISTVPSKFNNQDESGSKNGTAYFYNVNL